MLKLSMSGRVCSFCGRQGGRGRKFAGGFGALMCQNCVERYYTILSSARRTKAVSRPPWEQMSDEELLEVLPAIVATAEQVEGFLNEWIELVRDRKISWERIGKALGVSRQAAWERFSEHTPTNSRAH